MIDLKRKAPKGREFVFRAKDGREVGRASTLAQFREILRGIDEGCLLNHVNPGRNDFAAWLEGAFDEPDLAARMRRIPLDRAPKVVRAQLLLLFTRSHRTGLSVPSIKQADRPKASPPLVRGTRAPGLEKRVAEQAPREVKGPASKIPAPARPTKVGSTARKDDDVKRIPVRDKPKTPSPRRKLPRIRDGKGGTKPTISRVPTLEAAIRVASFSSGSGALIPRPPPGGRLDGLLWGLETYAHPADVLVDKPGFIGFVQVCREYLSNAAGELTPEARVALRHLVDNFPDDAAVVHRAQDFVETVRAVRGLVERTPVVGTPT
ncbi:MAG: hypothetical protein QGG26_13610 [Candidatus Undinarchaeales archaeon]|jgi:hypothetical protein|nr:hypothetical protein [Candidatus Undinarchaeales archaeon]